MGKIGSWEVLGKLGEGGQSNVFLVRSPNRIKERDACAEVMRNSIDVRKVRELADAVMSYARTDSPSELGAMKVFKIPSKGSSMSPPPGSESHEAIERLKIEISVLGQRLPGLPELFEADEDERWIVTEYFPMRTLEHNYSLFRGDAVAALRAFRSLVKTVESLHKQDYVHRDIKPANVFVRKDDDLVLGDFGIAYVPTAEFRLTMTGERVGPRDYMPQWANLGMRHDVVKPNIDIYMLGKLLWSMVDGRAVLPREYHRRREYEFDLTTTFPGDPHMHIINVILDRCVTEEESKCTTSASDLLIIVDTFLRAIDRGGQLLSDDVPRPCRVCGNGLYKVESHGPKHLQLGWQLSDERPEHVGVLVSRPFVCNYCGNIQFFKMSN